jgi:hypothetical protein
VGKTLVEKIVTILGKKDRDTGEDILSCIFYSTCEASNALTSILSTFGINSPE